MSHGPKKRHAREHGVVDLAPEAMNLLYQCFLATGALPENLRLAWQVLERALIARQGGGLTLQVDGGPAYGPPRELVFREAAHSCDLVRATARTVIEQFVRTGGDPSDPEFIPSYLPIPPFGSMALSILGWPNRLVHPAYQHQMQRVLRQHAMLRIRGRRSDAALRTMSQALSRFLKRGEIPKDDDLRFHVLTIAELFTINGHYVGDGGEDVLAAFDAVAKAGSGERGATLLRLSEAQARHYREGPYART